jgi:hypothetical protein
MSMKTKLIKLIKDLIKSGNKDAFDFQVFQNFKSESLTLSEILTRIATYSGLNSTDYEVIKKGIEKAIAKNATKEVKQEIKK